MKFLQTGHPPVSHAETLEMYAFMEAADESTRRGGVPVKLAEVLAMAVGKEASGKRKFMLLPVLNSIFTQGVARCVTNVDCPGL